MVAPKDCGNDEFEIAELGDGRLRTGLHNQSVAHVWHAAVHSVTTFYTFQREFSHCMGGRYFAARIACCTVSENEVPSDQ